jgi:hypothetical protein
MGEANARETGKIHDLLAFKNGMGAGHSAAIRRENKNRGFVP